MPDDQPELLAIVNARVATGDARRPWADALLLEGTRVVFAGSSAELRKRLAAGTRLVGAGGAMLAVEDGHVRAGLDELLRGRPS